MLSTIRKRVDPGRVTNHGDLESASTSGRACSSRTMKIITAELRKLTTTLTNTQTTVIYGTTCHCHLLSQTSGKIYELLQSDSYKSITCLVPLFSSCQAIGGHYGESSEEEYRALRCPKLLLLPSGLLPAPLPNIRQDITSPTGTVTIPPTALASVHTQAANQIHQIQRRAACSRTETKGSPARRAATGAVTLIAFFQGVDPAVPSAVNEAILTACPFGMPFWYRKTASAVFPVIAQKK